MRRWNGPRRGKFDFDPVQRVLEDRGKYVAACMTIVKAYLASSERVMVPPLQSFMPWSRAVRETLVWLGCADPCETMEFARAEDPERARLLQVLAAWHMCFGTKPTTVAEAIRV